MKSPPAPLLEDDDCDDIFGPSRTYPTGYSPPKTRPSMISPKYRAKEERRKVLKISINKLKKIEDPEANLCRSVLINNTMKRLQQEARDEKQQKQQLNYPRCYDHDDAMLKGEFDRNGEPEAAPPVEFVVENDFDTKLAEEISTIQRRAFGAVEEAKRPFDEMDDCMDVQDVLSQFYMPPTPRMLTCIDEEDEGEVAVKRGRFDEPNNKLATDDFNVNFISGSERLRYTATTPETAMEASSSFSCGHASMFNELQNNVYHNLIASLET